MVSDVIEDHILTGLFVTIPDTKENRDKYSWYYQNNYHHYVHKVDKVVEGLTEILAHACPVGIIAGREGSFKLNKKLKNKLKSNLPIGLLVPFQNNKISKLLLTNLEED